MPDTGHNVGAPKASAEIPRADARRQAVTRRIKRVAEHSWQEPDGSWIMSISPRGVPLGRGGGKRRRPPADIDLYVLSGLPGDRILVSASPNHRGATLYRRNLAVEAYVNRDWWTDDEHRAFWSEHLPAWPRGRGRPDTRELRAFALVEAMHGSGGSLALAQATAAELGWTTNDLRDRGILDLVRRMLAELAAPRPLRMPQVVTADEYGRLSRRIIDVWINGEHGKLTPEQRSVIVEACATAARLSRNGSSTLTASGGGARLQPR